MTATHSACLKKDSAALVTVCIAKCDMRPRLGRCCRRHHRHATSSSRARVASMQHAGKGSSVAVWAHRCDICHLGRASAAENQEKQGADLRLDTQLDCRREERLRVVAD
eukprot:scaffold127520_cov78-Phaeocystis_antarctica.AAC.1